VPRAQSRYTRADLSLSYASLIRAVRRVAYSFVKAVLNRYAGVWRPLRPKLLAMESEQLPDMKPKTLYMVVEHFKNKDAVPVYRRFRDRGRMAPEGLVYVSSWVDDKLERCYQLMETHDRRLLDQWIARWNDLVDFEVHPVITSTEAAERIAPQL